jgi:hypothetical protein
MLYYILWIIVPYMYGLKVKGISMLQDIVYLLPPFSISKGHEDMPPMLYTFEYPNSTNVLAAEALLFPLLQ